MRLPVIAPLLLAPLLLLAGCGDSDDGTGAPEADLPPRAAVLAPEDADVPGADWTPSPADVEAAEELLAPALAASEVEGLSALTDYYRQYTGVDGDALAVNALCDPEAFGFDWEQEWIHVDDGGPCFWQATVADGEVTSLTVNGQA